VLLATGGQDLYNKTFKDKDISGPGFRKALETFRRLKGYVDSGSPGRDWNLATAMVIQGRAGFQMMGDWAKAEFVNANQVGGKDYGCFMAGGPKMPYAIGGDVFVFPKSNKKDSDVAQKKLAELMISAPMQVAFNNRKGSIPIRTDVDTSKMDACAPAVERQRTAHPRREGCLRRRREQVLELQPAGRRCPQGDDRRTQALTRRRADLPRVP
jgi:glucose/mannose transport system substrate-binding protein